MPKINVYLSDDLAAAVREARIPVSSICQSALERAVRDVNSLREAEAAPMPDFTGLRPSSPFSRFTPRARHSIVLAQAAAHAKPHNYVGTEHLLLGIIDEGENLGLKTLTTLDIEIDDLRVEVEAAMGPATEPGAEHLPFTKLIKTSLELAAREAFSLGHNYVGCEHLLLGLIATEDGVASQVLARMGVDLRSARRAVTALLSGFAHAREQLTEAAPEPPAPDTTAAALAEIIRRLDALEARASS